MALNITVLGAGVSGLTTALLLANDFPSANITIVGQYLPGDINANYTSPFAGANWHSFSENDDLVLQEFDKPGYGQFLELAKEPRSGVWVKKSYAFLTKNTFEGDLGGDKSKFIKWYKDFMEDFEVLAPPEFPSDDIALGFSFKGVVITVPIYLNYLLQECLARGVALKRCKRLGSIAEVRAYVPQTDLVVNCAGGSATKIEGVEDDRRNYPVKGQVLLVSNNTQHKISVSMFDPKYPNELLYVMPRKEGGCIIGGCTYANDSSPEVDDELTQRMCQRAVKYVPELVDPSFQNNAREIDIVRASVGFRPAREGGARVEADPSLPWLVHNYGAGGGGYQGSFGFSQKVVQIVKQKVRQGKL